MYPSKFLEKWLSKIILKRPTASHLQLYRALERASVKLVNARSHLLFNETCYNNNLLPQFTHVNVPDEATRPTSTVLDLRRELNSNAIEKQRKAIAENEKLVSQAYDALKNTLNSDLRMKAYSSLLQKILLKKETELNIIHMPKIMNLFGGETFLKQERDFVINLSSTPISEDIMQVMD